MSEKFSDGTTEFEMDFTKEQAEKFEQWLKNRDKQIKRDLLERLEKALPWNTNQKQLLMKFKKKECE